MKKLEHLSLVVGAALFAAFIAWLLLADFSVKLPHYDKNDFENSDTLQQARIETLCKLYAIKPDLAIIPARCFGFHAKRSKLPWELFAAITFRESGFNPRARSNKGAKGPMQLMETTFRTQCEKKGITYFEDRTIWITEINYDMGCQTVIDLYKQGKSIEFAIKGYNGGPGYAKQTPGGECEAETKRFHQSVMEEYAKIRATFRKLTTGTK